MRQINHGRRRRVQALLDRLREIANEKKNLLARLEDLQEQEKAVRQEHITLHNLDAATSDLPDEILASIFEAGMWYDKEEWRDFQIRVSHVSHRWRAIALATTQLWSNIQYTETTGRTPSKSTGKVLAYLSRSKQSPVDIYIQASESRDLDPALLKSILDHIGHCSRLRIYGAGRRSQREIIEAAFRQPAPALVSLRMQHNQKLLFFGQLLPLGAARLKLVELDMLRLIPPQISHCLSAFESITHLRLTSLLILNEDTCDSLRTLLAALKSLCHLELEPVCRGTVPPPALALVLPNLRFLHVGWTRSSSFFNGFVGNLCAVSLNTFSFPGWHSDEDIFKVSGTLGRCHFPSLRELIVVDEVSTALEELEHLAETFPDIDSLTCRVENVDVSEQDDGIDAIIGAILEGPSVRWPKLQSIAVSALRKPLDAQALCQAICNLQAHRPLRKLSLPRSYALGTDTSAMQKLREIIQVEECGNEWQMFCV